MGKNKKFESTAKELAFKAYCDALKDRDTRYYEFDPTELYEITQKFECWWLDNYGNRFQQRYSVFIDLKKYILAE